MESMDGWLTQGTGDLRLARVPVPVPSPDELLIRVEACGLCRTDLHVIDGEIPRHRDPVIPGHQVVGRVIAVGDAVVEPVTIGELAGVAWLRRTCGQCAWCRTGRENLCPRSTYTGWDSDGGFAPLVTVPAAYAYRLGSADPVITAPLLCAGIIGYRALTRAALPPGGLLGLYGFGSSAHITAQLARASGAEIAVMTRDENDRALASRMGAVFVGGMVERPPRPLDAAIVFAPAGEIVPAALEATAPGGTVVLAGIHMSDIPTLVYDTHLFRERDLRTVTANTRADGEAFLRVARAVGITPQVATIPFAQVDQAVAQLRAGGLSGSTVITFDD